MLVRQLALVRLFCDISDSWRATRKTKRVKLVGFIVSFNPLPYLTSPSEGRLVLRRALEGLPKGAWSGLERDWRGQEAPWRGPPVPESPWRSPAGSWRGCRGVGAEMGVGGARRGLESVDELD